MVLEMPWRANTIGRSRGSGNHRRLSPAATLLMGAPGTGKMMTTSVLAGELGLPLTQCAFGRSDHQVHGLDRGQTTESLRFDRPPPMRILFDEFDAIGSQREFVGDIGEDRSILNSFMQMIEQDDSQSLIMVAINYSEIIDPALFRRFDDVLYYNLRSEASIITIIKFSIGKMVANGISWKCLATKSIGLGCAEIDLIRLVSRGQRLVLDRFERRLEVEEKFFERVGIMDMIHASESIDILMLRFRQSAREMKSMEYLQE